MRVPGSADVVRRLDETGLGRHGSGIDEADLRRLEEDLAVSLPPGYRRFLEDLDWLAAPGVDVFGAGAQVPADLDLRAMTADARRRGVPVHLVPFARDGTGEVLFLDAHHSGPYESPVYRLAPESPSQPEYLAHDFASWLWMRVAEVTEREDPE